MNRFRQLSYLGLVLGFMLLLGAAFVASYVAGLRYSIPLMVAGVILVMIGLIYRWKS
jgi:hypothetical protein